MRSANDVADASGRQYHIGAGPGDLAERILLVGDPERAGKVAERFDRVRVERRHREYVAYTGTVDGREISVLATGIGEDNTEIAVIEACQIVERPTFIRCGTCSTLQRHVALGDLAISRGAVRLGSTATFFAPEGYPAIADTDVVLALGAACKKLDLPFHAGITATAPGFYGAQSREIPGFPPRFPNLLEELSRLNVLNIEMEAATLFVLSQLKGVRAGAICAVIGNRKLDQFADAELYKRGENACIDASLKAFSLLDRFDREKVERKLPFWIPE